MKYETNAPSKITHRVTLDAGDLLNAIHAFLRASPEFAERISPVEYTDLLIDSNVNNEVTVSWETEMVTAPPNGGVRPPEPLGLPDKSGAFGNGAVDARMATASGDEPVSVGDLSGDKPVSAGSPRQGRFAVVSDQGNMAGTGDIATYHDDYDSADVARHEQINISPRASIVFVAKSGSRYLPDKVTPAIDD